MNIHVYPSVFRNESRMLRIGNTLEKNGLFNDIVFIAVEEGSLPAEERITSRQRVVRLGPPKQGIGRIKHLIAWSRQVLRFARTNRITCINCHSLLVLPACLMIKYRTGAALIYDTHELESKPASAGKARQFVYRIIEQMLMPFVDVTFVVNSAIGDWYRHAYPSAPIHEIKNYPSLQQNVEAGIDLRERFRIPQDAMLFLYQGVLGAGRGIDLMLDAFTSKEMHQDNMKRHVVFMGNGPLEEKILQASKQHAFIHHLPAVEPNELLSMTRQADVTVGLIEPISKSYEMSLPNKLLESLASGVPMLATDLPEYRRELQEGTFGWLIQPAVPAVVEAVQAITEEDVAQKKAQLRGWWELHHWEQQEAQIVHWYRSYAGV